MDAKDIALIVAILATLINVAAYLMERNELTRMRLSAVDIKERLRRLEEDA